MTDRAEAPSYPLLPRPWVGAAVGCGTGRRSGQGAALAIHEELGEEADVATCLAVIDAWMAQDDDAEPDGDTVLR